MVDFGECAFHVSQQGLFRAALKDLRDKTTPWGEHFCGKFISGFDQAYDTEMIGFWMTSDFWRHIAKHGISRTT